MIRFQPIIVAASASEWNPLAGARSYVAFRRLRAIGIIGLVAMLSCLAQQVADTNFKPAIASPAFAPGRGPVVAIDEAHHNFHTAGGRYAPFADLLRRDGFTVRSSVAAFSKATLDGIRVLVIANALHARNGAGNWSLPTPSAFTADEIAAVKAWVQAGGSLFLIVDHMPFPGGNADLSAAFGFAFSNGFAGPADGKSPLIFRRSDGLLRDHAILRGRSPAEAVEAVATFTGSAFQCPDTATSLLILPKGSVSREPEVAWRFTDTTKRTEVGGWSQGAAMVLGKGRLAVFGEAAMFSAQTSGPEKRPMGMNAPAAKQNPQFLLNVVRWLSDAIE